MRLNTDIIGEFIRVLLLIIAIAAPLFGLWPAIGGISGVYALPAESTKVHKDLGVTTAPWETESFSSISWIHVTVTATREVDVRIIAMNNREIQVHNASGFAVEEDRTVVAGGGANGGQGIGHAVSLSGSHGGPGRYMIIVTASDDTRAANFTDRDIEYTLEWQVHKLDPTVFLMGLIIFSMVFTTEYILIARRDVRAMSRKLDKLISEGGAPARAPSAALGVATPPSFGPPPAAAAEVPAREEGPRRSMFGGRGSTASAQAPAYDEQPAEEVYPPPPAIAMEPPAPRAPPIPPQPTPYGAPTGRYGAPPPPAYGEPESFVPSAPAPPPMPRPAAPSRQSQAPPPAPAGPAAQPQGPEPVTKVRCPQCKHIVPVYTAERPTPIKCPNCGKRGMLPR